MIRPSCGTARGALAHQAAGEPWCGWCKTAERAAALDAERFPSRPLPLEPLPLPECAYAPVTPEQGAGNAALLDAEVLAYEREWVSGHRSQAPRLRAVPPPAEAGAA
jgi:hypothetical protein